MLRTTALMFCAAAPINIDIPDAVLPHHTANTVAVGWDPVLSSGAVVPIKHHQVLG